MKTSVYKRALSALLALAIIVGMIPVISRNAEAASNIAGTFQGQDADVFSALGFDTSVMPEGYDAETTDNPYGRDKLAGDQVFELLLAGSEGTKLFGHDNNSLTVSSISGKPEKNKSGLRMSAVAAGDFDGDGLAGEVAFVGYSSIAYNTHSRNADLYLCVYDGKSGSFSDLKKIGAFNPAKVTTSGGTNYSRHDYAWQNLLQVTAGDYDGDGVSEIAAYVADDGNARVDIFKFQKTSDSTDTSWLDITQWSRTWSHVISNTGNKIPNMVSLVSADINRDGVDDLGISYGRFAPGSKDFSLQQADKSKAVILWGARSDMLQTSVSLDLNEETLGDLVRVSLFTGDLDGDGYAELIATGHPLSDAEDYDFRIADNTTVEELPTVGNTQRTITTYIYDAVQGLVVNYSGMHKPIDGSWATVGEGEGSSTNWQSANGFDATYFSQPVMRTNAAVIYPQGRDYPMLYLDSCLYEYTEGQVTLKMSLDDDKYDGENDLAGSGNWGITAANNNITFTANYAEYGAVSGDINGEGFDILATGVFWGGSSEYDYIANDLPAIVDEHHLGYMALGGSSSGTLTSSVNTGASSSDAQATAFSLAMVDTDIDTVLIEYTGIHYLTYSDPKVLAIIAAAPYFADVDRVTGYKYAWQNTTSYSKITGDGKSDIVGVDLEVGGWLSADVTVGGGKVVTEFALMYTLEWEKETSKSTEYTLTFETSQDEDSVAFFSIPTENYIYKVSTPDGKGGYIENFDTISNTFTPCYQILTLDYYESIQGNYDNLPQISGKALTSTPGDPGSYPTSTSGYDVITQWNDDPAGVSFGNGAITQEITVTTEESNSYNMGAALDYKIGYGGEFQSDLAQTDVEMAGGAQFSLNPTGGWSTFKLDGTSFSGTVTNMPLEFQEYGYYYTWKLFAYKYDFDGGDSIPVVSYVVGDVSAPPLLPEDFQQDYDRTESDKNVLTWTYDDTFSSFKVYKYYDFPVGGGLQQILDIPANCDPRTEVTNSTGTYIYGYMLKADEDGDLYKEYYFEDCNLAPYTEYDYSIQVERLSKVPPRSSPSELVTVRTKAAVGNPLIPISESDGENDGMLLVYPDKTSYLTVQVTGPEGELASDYYTTVQYQWQKMEKGAWTNLVGETNMTMTFASAGVETAGEYRCLVNVLTQSDNTAISSYTEPVSLTHAKRVSYIDAATLSAQDISGGGVYVYAKVCNAHGDSAAVPSGTVTFNLVNNATGKNYQLVDTLNAEGVAEVSVDDVLPEGMYTMEAYYSGSFIFMSSTAQTLYLSQRGSGYDIDAPTSVTYGDGTEVIARAVTKSAGITTAREQKADSFTMKPVSALTRSYSFWYLVFPLTEIKDGDQVNKGRTYSYAVDSVLYYFTASHSAKVHFENGYLVYDIDADYLTYTGEGGKYALAENAPADTYLIEMTYAEGVNTHTAYSAITVVPRAVTLQLPKSRGDEGAAAPYTLDLGTLQLVSGSWADCDLDENGALKQTLRNLDITLAYYNTANTYVSAENVGNLCGYYTVNSSTSVSNYKATFRSGSYTVLGGTNAMNVGTRYFEGKDVGALYVVSPDYAQTRLPVDAGGALTQKYATGTRIVFTAVPDEGYAIYAWYINGVKQNTTATSLAYTMLNEQTTVEVQFDVKKNTLGFGTAGDAGGGSIVCSDPSLTSGSVVLPNAYMTFTAKANPGYHFKEWRYTELGSGTVYDDDDSGKMESSFELLMPVAGCSVYAVFERDFYILTYTDDSGNDGLCAWYTEMQPGATEGEIVYVESGDPVKGDTEVTIAPKAGYSWNDDYNYVVDGSTGTADYAAGTYIFQIAGDTTVYGNTVRGKFDLTLGFDVEEKSDQTVNAAIIYSVDGVEETLVYDKKDPTITLKDIPGGAKIKAQVVYPSFYLLDGWTCSATKLTASTQVNKLAVKAGTMVSAGGAYWYTADNGSGSKSDYYFVAPASGILEYNADAVTIYAAGAVYTINELAAGDALLVSLTEKDLHKVTAEDIAGHGTYSFDLPEGAYRDGEDIYVHDGDDFDVLITPDTGWTVTYWNIKPTNSPEQEVKATSLRYLIPAVQEDFHLTPIFAATTYNTITWPAISQEQNYLTLSEYNCVASVVSGNSFSFTLSGDGLELLDKAYANGNPFLPKADGGLYTYEDIDGIRVYTISNIRTHQVVSVGFREVGIAVGGEDISGLRGNGWHYDAPNQTLVIEKSNLTISGKNDTAVASKLTVEVLAESVSFADLDITSKASGAVVTLSASEAIVNITGTNRIHRTDGAKAIYGVDQLTIRGTGSLTTSAESVTPSYEIQAEDSLKILGRCTVNTEGFGGKCVTSHIDSNTVSIAGTATLNVFATNANFGIISDLLTVGAYNSEDAPTVRVVSGTLGIHVTYNLLVYGGDLSIKADSYALDVAGMIYSYGGTMELTAEDILTLGSQNKAWYVYHTGGYSLRYMTDSSVIGMTSPKLKSEYSNTSYDVLAAVDITSNWIDYFDDALNTYYSLRLTPLAAESGMTLTVEVDGKSYTGELSLDENGDCVSGYYYIEKGSDDVHFLPMGYNKKNSISTDLEADPEYTLVAFGEYIGGLQLRPYTYTWKVGEYTSNYFDDIKVDDSVKYAYTLSGAMTGISGVVAEAAHVSKLTLDNATVSELSALGVPVWLNGDNYIVSGLTLYGYEADERVNYDLDLYSADGAGTLRVSGPYAVVSLTHEDDAVVKLHNVKLFELSTDVNFSNRENDFVISYTDADGNEIPYGMGWMLDAGEKAATASPLTESKVDGTLGYMRFYRNTKDATVDPQTVTFDKVNGTDSISGQEDACIEIFEPIDDGQIRFFDKAELPQRQDDASGYVVLLDAAGNETKWTLGDQYTWTRGSDLSKANVLAISKNTLGGMELGVYTVRIFFYDESTSDATYYYTDVTLTVTDVNRISGSITVQPQEKLLGRGESVDLTTAFTGTTVLAYDWSIAGNVSACTKIVGDGSAVKLVIGDDEAVTGTPLMVTVRSYADEGKTVELGWAIAEIAVIAKAESIDITCVGETPSGDESYTLHHTNDDGSARSWDFEAAVTMDHGSADVSRVSWSLWGAKRKATSIDSATGVLTVSPLETGIGGKMQITATYTNLDGTAYTKTIDIWLSTDVWVSADNEGAAGGSITGIFAGEEAITGGYVGVGTTVTVTAEPEVGYKVNTWYINGESVMNTTGFTAEGNTLTFVTADGASYVITADYIRENCVTVHFEPIGPGMVEAVVDDTYITNGQQIVESSTVTVIATAENYCIVKAWYLNGELIADFTQNTLTLTDVMESCTIKVEFEALPRNVTLENVEGGSVTATVNGTVQEESSFAVTTLDTVILQAVAQPGYRFVGWSEGIVNAGGSAGVIMPGEGDVAVQAVFEKIPVYDVTIYTNSYENGAGTVTDGTVTVPMASNGIVQVMEGNDLVLTAVSQPGCYFYGWTVDGAEYEVNGDTLTILEVTGDVTVTAKFRRIKLNVTYTGDELGSVSGEAELDVMGVDLGSTLTGNDAVWADSDIVLTMTPVAGSTLQSLTVNGEIVDTVFDANTNTFGFVLRGLAEDTVLAATFVTLPTFEVKIPTQFTETVEIPADPADPEAPTTEEKVTGTLEITFTPDGVSADGVEDANTDFVTVMQGGTAIITARAEAGYTLDLAALQAQIDAILAESNATAQISATVDGVKVTITGIDTDLDLTGMESPFEAAAEEQELVSVTIAENLMGGSVTVTMNGVLVESGAKIPVNTQLIITATPDVHHKLEGIQVNEITSEATITAAEDVTVNAVFVVEHTYDDGVVTEATCTVDGYTTYTCIHCDDSYVADAVPAPGHSFTNYISDNNATFDADGTKTAKCDHCDATDTVIEEGSRLSIPDRITSDVFIVIGGIIRKVPLGTTVAELIAGINEKQYIHVFRGTEEVSGDTLVATGMVVKLMYGATVKDVATVVVTGDLNGDGKATITDMLNIKSQLLGKTELGEYAAMAADLTGEGKITITDFVQIKAYILDKGSITAR